MLLFLLTRPASKAVGPSSTHDTTYPEPLGPTNAAFLPNGTRRLMSLKICVRLS